MVRILKLITHQHRHRGLVMAMCLPTLLMHRHPTTLQLIKVVTATTNSLQIRVVVSNIMDVRGGLLQQATMAAAAAAHNSNMEIIGIPHLIEEETGDHLRQHHIHMAAGRNHTKISSMYV